MTTTTRYDHIGNGWHFPFRFTQTGGVAVQRSDTDDEALELVRQAIIVVVGTREQSRKMVRGFGSPLFQALFSPNDPGALEGIFAFRITEAVRRWEARARNFTISFRAETQERQAGQLFVNARYTLADRQVSGNFVLPFILADDGRLQFQDVTLLTSPVV